ncbi:hypothetical protein AAVH_06907 [Aphelenchoides avenae]|nr:hypothetical protein AAVH_06907 [Aphelenchus avenae]
MPVVTRQTVTTTRTTAGGGTITVIPVWSIKLITAILSVVILVLALLMHDYMWQRHSRTFMCIVLTCGFLLGWSLPSVFNRFLPFHKVDVTLHSIIVGLVSFSLILCIIYLLHQSDYSRTEDYKLMVGITVLMAIETLVCFLLLSWLFWGNYTIVDTR